MTHPVRRLSDSGAVADAPPNRRVAKRALAARDFYYT
jgi:hypothetical protein